MVQEGSRRGAVAKLVVLALSGTVAGAGWWVIPGPPSPRARYQAAGVARALSITPSPTVVSEELSPAPPPAPRRMRPAPAPARPALPSAPVVARAPAEQVIDVPAPAPLVAVTPAVGARAPGLVAPEPHRPRQERWAGVGASFARAGMRIGAAFTP